METAALMPLSHVGQVVSRLDREDLEYLHLRPLHRVCGTWAADRPACNPAPASTRAPLESTARQKRMNSQSREITPTMLIRHAITVRNDPSRLRKSGIIGSGGSRLPDERDRSRGRYSVPGTHGSGEMPATSLRHAPQGLPSFGPFRFPETQSPGDIRHPREVGQAASSSSQTCARSRNVNPRGQMA